MENSELMRGVMEMVVLKFLAERPMYGYEIIKRVNVQSNGAFRWKEGTLYPALHRMAEAGLIESYWNLEAGVRPRKYYRLTTEGVTQVKLRTTEGQAFAAALTMLLA